MDDPLGLGDEPAKKPKKKGADIQPTVFGSKVPIRSGKSSADIAGTRSTLPKALNLPPVKTLLPQPKRQASEMTAAELARTPAYVSPVHDALRSKAGTLEEAMARFDSENPGAGATARASFKAGLIAYANDERDPTPDRVAAARGEQSLYDSYLRESRGEPSVAPGGYARASKAISDLGADVAEKLSPIAQLSPQAREIVRGVGRLGAGIIDPGGPPQLAKALIEDPVGTAKGLTTENPVFDPNAPLEERVVGGGTLAAIAAPVAMKGMALRPKLPVRTPKAPKVDPLTVDPLGLNETPKVPAKFEPKEIPDYEPGTAPELKKLTVVEGGKKSKVAGLPSDKAEQAFVERGIEELVAKGTPRSQADAQLRARFRESGIGEGLNRRAKPELAVVEGRGSVQELALTNTAKARARKNALPSTKGPLKAPKATEESFSFPAIVSNPNRVQPAPIPGGKAKPPSEIIFDAGKSVGKNIGVGGHARGSLGTYFPGSTKTVVRFAGDIDTAAHELSHALDDAHSIVGQWSQPRKRSPFDAELEPFWVNTSRKSYSLKQKRAEGVAEWIRAYVVNPDEARRLAPGFTQHFESKVPADVRARLDDFSKNVREYLGDTSLGRVKVNIAFEPPKKGGTAERISTFFNPDQPGYATSGVDRLRMMVTDDLAPVESAVRETMERRGIERMEPDNPTGTLKPEDDPVLLARGLAYFKNRFDDILKNGMIDGRGKRVTGPVADIFKPLNHTTRKALEEDLKDMLALATSERVIEKTSDLGRDNLAGFGGGFYSDASEAANAIRELQANPERFTALNESVKTYRKFANSVLDYLVEKGRMSAKDRDNIKAKNQHYAAMQRIVDDVDPAIIGGKRGKLGSVKDVTKKFKGSTRQIQSPLVNLMEQSFAAIKEADRNEVVLKWRNLLTTARSMYQGAPVDLDSIGRKVSSKEKGATRVYVDGKPEHWKFEEGIQDSIKGLGEAYTPNWLSAVPEFLAKALRASITNLPPFTIRNKIRDVQHRLVVGRSGGSILSSFKRSTPEERELYSQYGAGIARGHYLENAPDFYAVQKNLLKEMAEDKSSVLLIPRKGWDWYNDLTHSVERSTRLGEFDAAKKKAMAAGMDEYNANLYAAGQARELLDFARGGKAAKFLNRYIPFLNASIQGLSRTGKAMAENPKGFLGKFAGYVVTPTVAVYMWNRGQGKEALEEYRQLPSHQRDMFYNLKVAPGIWLRIPKPFEIGVLASGVERAIDKALGNEKAFEGYSSSLKKAAMPLDESAMMGGPLKPIIENIVNYDTFRDKSIVPPYEDELALELRDSDKSASRLGQILQDVLNVDARKIDHYIESQFADIGRTATTLSDLGRDDKNIPSARLINLGTGVTTAEPGYGSPDVQWVLQQAKQVGIRKSPLGSLLSAVFDAKTEAARDQASKALRDAAKALREKVESSTKGKAGKESLEAAKSALESSGYFEKEEKKAKAPKVSLPPKGVLIPKIKPKIGPSLSR